MPQYMNKWFVFDNHDCQFNPSNPYQYPYGYHLFTDPHCDLPIYLNESFETNINQTIDLPQGWQKSDNNWERVAPPSSIGIHHENMVMKFKASTMGTGNYSYLTSPILNISEEKQVLKISVHHDKMNSQNDKLLIEYESNGNGIWIPLQYSEIRGYNGYITESLWSEQYL